MPEERVCFGLIGAGGVAQALHLPHLARASNIRLKIVCDQREELVREAQAKWGIPAGVTNAAALFADPEVQAVVITTREDAQASLTIRALEAGKHVYVEKPLAETEAAFLDVVQAQQKARRFVAVGFNRRFAPAYRKAREILRVCGGAKNMHYRIADPYVHGWGRGYPPGVRMLHETCHVFDALRWFAASEAVSVYCAQSRSDEESLTIRFASGCVASITSSGYATPDVPKERLEVFADGGGVTIEEFVQLRTFGRPEYSPVYRFAGHAHPDQDAGHVAAFHERGEDALYAVRRRAMEDPDAAVPYLNYLVDKGWLAALEHFAESVASGRSPENATALDALQAHRLARAAIRSRDTWEVVKL
ncbi:MAG: Gfo/Idh/MocA family oxidoreductase [Candidatus Coatesbacteria bacterium]